MSRAKPLLAHILVIGIFTVMTCDARAGAPIQTASDQATRDVSCSRMGYGCHASTLLTLLPDNGVRVVSASISIEILCRGQRGPDMTHKVYLDNDPSKSILPAGSVDMTLCDGKCSEAGYVTIVQAAPLDIGTARYVRVVIWSDVNQPETSSSALFGNEGQEFKGGEYKCTGQKTLVARIKVWWTYELEQGPDTTIYAVLAILWVPLALSARWYYTRYYRRSVLAQVQAARDAVAAEVQGQGGDFAHLSPSGPPFLIHPREFKLLEIPGRVVRAVCKRAVAEKEAVRPAGKEEEEAKNEDEQEDEDVELEQLLSSDVMAQVRRLCQQGWTLSTVQEVEASTSCSGGRQLLHALTSSPILNPLEKLFTDESQLPAIVRQQLRQARHMQQMFPHQRKRPTPPALDPGLCNTLLGIVKTVSERHCKDSVSNGAVTDWSGRLSWPVGSTVLEAHGCDDKTTANEATRLRRVHLEDGSMHVKTPFRQGQALNARVGPPEHLQSPTSEISYRIVPDADAPMRARRQETEKGPAAVAQHGVEDALSAVPCAAGPMVPMPALSPPAPYDAFIQPCAIEVGFRPATGAAHVHGGDAGVLLLMTRAPRVEYQGDTTGEVVVDGLSGRLQEWAHSEQTKEFQDKVVRLRRQLASIRRSQGLEQRSSAHHASEEVCAHIQRHRAFEDTIAILTNITNEDLVRAFRVHFEGEDASDLGGPAREWARLVSTAMVEPHRRLFVPDTSQTCYDILPHYAPSVARVRGWRGATTAAGEGGEEDEATFEQLGRFLAKIAQELKRVSAAIGAPKRAVVVASKGDAKPTSAKSSSDVESAMEIGRNCRLIGDISNGSASSRVSGNGGQAQETALHKAQEKAGWAEEDQNNEIAPATSIAPVLPAHHVDSSDSRAGHAGATDSRAARQQSPPSLRDSLRVRLAGIFAESGDFEEASHLPCSGAASQIGKGLDDEAHVSRHSGDSLQLDAAAIWRDIDARSAQPGQHTPCCSHVPEHRAETTALAAQVVPAKDTSTAAMNTAAEKETGEEEVLNTKPKWSQDVHLANDLDQLKTSDVSLWRSLTWVLENDIDADDGVQLFFCVGDKGADGRQVEVDLAEGGAEMRVTESNKYAYVAAHLDWCLRLRARRRVRALARGMAGVVPCAALLGFTGQELRLLVCGAGMNLDVADWRANTLYTNGYAPGHPLVEWFWSWILAAEHSKRCALLSFVTGTSRVPAGGFAELQGADSAHRFTIQRAPLSDRLPQAHTCFNILVLPEYGSEDVLASKIEEAIEHVNDGLLLT